MLYVILGSSGSGKTTLGENVFGKDREVVSTTTRPMRPGETNDVDYHFVSEQRFEQMVNNRELLEYTQYGGYYYGLSKEEVRRATTGHHYAVVDQEGHKSLLETDIPFRSIFVFVGKERLRERLAGRGENNDFIEHRLDLYEQELELVNAVDYVISNHNEIDLATTQLRQIVRAEAPRAGTPRILRRGV